MSIIVGTGTLQRIRGKLALSCVPACPQPPAMVAAGEPGALQVRLGCASRAGRGSQSGRIGAQLRWAGGVHALSPAELSPQQTAVHWTDAGNNSAQPGNPPPLALQSWERGSPGRPGGDRRRPSVLRKPGPLSPADLVLVRAGARRPGPLCLPRPPLPAPAASFTSPHFTSRPLPQPLPGGRRSRRNAEASRRRLAALRHVTATSAQRSAGANFKQRNKLKAPSA